MPPDPIWLSWFHVPFQRVLHPRRSSSVRYRLFSVQRISQPWRSAPLPPGAITLSDTTGLNFIWLDVRSEADYSEAHIPEALHFDSAEWDQSLIALMDTWGPQPRPIIVYCSSESCDSSEVIANRLRDALQAEVYYLKGGWAAWSSANK